MTTVVLLVLALAWGAVLLFWLRARRRSSPPDSVSLFYRDLRVLQRAAPATREPAHRLRGPSGPSWRAVTRGPVAVTAPTAGWVPGPLTPADTGVGHGRDRPRPVTASGGVSRRRSVALALTVLVVASLAAAVADPSPATAVVQLLTDAAWAGYLAGLTLRARHGARGSRRLPVAVVAAPAPVGPPGHVTVAAGAAGDDFEVDRWDDGDWRRAVGS